MRVTSRRKLAQALGVSETAIRKAERAGRIAPEADGGWDVEKIRQAWQANTDAAQQRQTPHRLKPVPEAAVGAVRETLSERGETVSAGGMTFLQAKVAGDRIGVTAYGSSLDRTSRQATYVMRWTSGIVLLMLTARMISHQRCKSPQRTTVTRSRGTKIRRSRTSQRIPMMIIPMMIVSVWYHCTASIVM